MVSIEDIDERISHKDESFLSLAMKLAETSACGQKHGAVVVRGGSVLALGVNRLRNVPSSLGRNQKKLKELMTVHAEIDALSKVKNPKGVTVYVARVNSAGDAMYSRPCDNCYRRMASLGVKKVVFTS